MLFATAPGVLGDILHRDGVPPRHKIESVRELRAISANGPEDRAPASDRFQIVINLGSDTLRFDKSIAPDSNNIDPNDINNTDQTRRALLAANATNKPTESGGEPL